MVIGTTAIARPGIRSYVLDTLAINNGATDIQADEYSRAFFETPPSPSFETLSTLYPSPMFSTIIQGADDTVGCSVQGFTVARFNLCGDSDDRVISLSGGPYTNVSWQLLGGSCTPDINEDCPNTGSCYTQVGSGQTFALDATTVSATLGAEYRVIADGQTFYFKVKKSTITQTYVKQDNICGVPGRIQITNLSSAMSSVLTTVPVSDLGKAPSSTIFLLVPMWSRAD